ncbi:MAG: response regulator [Anaerolineae bacterium]
MTTSNADTNTNPNIGTVKTGRLRILVIEDDQDLGELITFILAEEGYQADLISDGTMAMDWLQNQTPNVILLDIHLPGVSGLDILHFIRSQERMKQTRVMVTTADEKMAAICAESADLVFRKPYTVSDLVGGISRLSAH